MTLQDKEILPGIKILAIATLVTALSGITVAGAAEQIYPAGYDITSEYSLNSGSVAVSDTLIITRSLANLDHFDITGLYFSETLPLEFSVSGLDVVVNGVSVPCHAYTMPADAVGPDHTTHFWVLDANGHLEGIDTQLAPGDLAQLQIRLTCNTPGHYSLPMRSTVFYGSGAGFFSAGEPVQVVFFSPTRVPDSGRGVAAVAPILTSAYPNPFNLGTTIGYSGRQLGGRRMFLSIHDLAGRRLDHVVFTAAGDEGTITWRGSAALNSGLYLYSIGDDTGRTARGRLLLVK